MGKLVELLEVIGARRPVYVQTHDFPDCDAVAAAFGLQALLKGSGVPSRIVFGGDVQRDSLRRMIRDLGIEVEQAAGVEIMPRDPIVIVDGCKGSKNVTDLPGDEIAVIDHHDVRTPDNVAFVDIRPGLGACATMIFGYFREAQKEIPREVATALMIGINMDTALLTRQVSREDIQAYADLYARADMRLENSILRNSIQTRDLAFYRHALANVQVRDGVAFCWFPEGCNQNLLGILGDFFITLEEAEFVVLCARNDGVINVSVRSEREAWNASRIVQDALSGIGFGGGHSDMAGGIIRDPRTIDGPQLRVRFLRALHIPS
ncbi:MAG: bifunctional oligoribonuclease/PAP phosphatase NrnA [Spirochaetia bacterium]